MNNKSKSKAAAAAQVYPTAESGSMPHARDADIVPSQHAAPQMLVNPGV